jgi:class 3 adenylate cyclase/pimeloyl-ACP methyl ester carboxylesterase
MMEGQVRYVKSADGTRIAVSVVGSGQPLIFIHNVYLTIEGYWEIPSAQENIARLARDRQVVLFDQRGAGLSALDATDYSLDALVLDLSAVVDSLGAPTVDLLTSGPVGPIAISYAVTHPERVRRLVMDAPYARNRDMALDERRRIVRLLADVDWEFYLHCLALSNYGWTEVGRRIADKQAKEADRDAWDRAWRALSLFDVTDILSEVQCPTLVLERTGTTGPPASAAATREVAVAIPGARLSRFAPDQITILASGWDSALRAITDFLDEDKPAISDTTLPSGTADSSSTADSPVRVILFIDIADSTALTERLGDAAFRAKSRDLDGALRTIIRERDGTAIEGKLLGDGVLAVFTSARQAITCAATCHAAASDIGLELHAGIHAGDVIRESDPDGRGNVYGGAVNIAARVAAASAPGETLVSQTVRDLARTSAGVSFEDRGEQALKGIDDPVRLFAVR